ncbi:phytanoyl-CoA dioxygenase family protein [Nocardia sp. BMG51109]|uniref:phytanoyl-CoA dioxygenase family protein n=1 Tax=Nocardia sp. BMG51109 TaxID=1056816 RepID=UPI000465CEC2|nr:phytanoyl-CoA dioxygenase family protein [Nocardia sp. BMG51109]
MHTLSPADTVLLPSGRDVAFFAEHGWFLSRKLLADTEIDALVAATEGFYAGERSRCLPVRPPQLKYWKPEHGAVKRENDYVHYESDAIAELCLKPLIGAAAARLLQVREIRVLQATLIYKPPVVDEPTNIVPLHSDRHYWATSASDNIVTAFIPLHDCGEENGTIAMVDGSHRWPESGVDERVAAGQFAAGAPATWEALVAAHAARNGSTLDPIPMVIPKGHMSFHHSRTYHGSGANRTGRPRRAISLHLQDTANTYREITLADGTLATYNHDWLVRRTPGGHPDYADPEYCPLLWSTP